MITICIYTYIYIYIPNFIIRTNDVRWWPLWLVAQLLCLLFVVVGVRAVNEHYQKNEALANQVVNGRRFWTKIDNLRDLGLFAQGLGYVWSIGRCRFYLLPSQSEIPVSCRRMGLENCCLWPFWHVWFFGDVWWCLVLMLQKSQRTTVWMCHKPWQ